MRRGGRVILFGVNQHAERALNQYAITRYEASILGSYIQRTAFPKVVRILEAGLLPVEKLITHRLRLNEVGEALEAMRVGEAIKAVLNLNSVSVTRFIFHLSIFHLSFGIDRNSASLNDK